MTAAVVTGGTRGVGKAIASALACTGYEVAEVGRTSPRFSADVRSPASVERLRDVVEQSLGHPSILVNAAGTFGPVSLIANSDSASWIDTVMVNTIGTYLTCRAFVPAMIEHGWGRIVNVSSAASLYRPGVLYSAYGTSKAALNQSTRHLAAELDNTGVTANVIHPGDVKTEMWADIKTQADKLGPIATDYRKWVDWVEETGGDPVEKAAKLVLEIIASDISGQFLWIDDPLQEPLQSWNDTDPAR